MIERLRLPATAFFVASLVGLMLVYYLLGGNQWKLALGALAYGAALGFAVQLAFRQPLPKLRIALASFCGAFVLWLPLVLVTYGFALAATPVFAAYGVMVALGSHIPARVRSARAARGAVRSE